MMCAETVHEIVVERHLGFQAFETLPQAVFAIGKKNGVHEAEIGFRYFVAIGTEERFNRYIHNVL
mgnify:FL=1